MKQILAILVLCVGILMTAGCVDDGQFFEEEEDEDDEDFFEGYTDIATVNDDDIFVTNDKLMEMYDSLSTIDLEEGQSKRNTLYIDNEDSEDFHVVKAKVKKEDDIDYDKFVLSWYEHEINKTVRYDRYKFTITVTNNYNEAGKTIPVSIYGFFTDNDNDKWYTGLTFVVNLV